MHVYRQNVPLYSCITHLYCCSMLKERKKMQWNLPSLKKNSLKVKWCLKQKWFNSKFSPNPTPPHPHPPHNLLFSVFETNFCQELLFFWIISQPLHLKGNWKQMSLDDPVWLTGHQNAFTIQAIKIHSLYRPSKSIHSYMYRPLKSSH